MSFHAGIAIGKFHGVIAPTTPTGIRTLIMNLSRSSDGVVCPKQPPALAAHVVAHVDRFLDVAARLGLHLPHLAGHQVGQLRLVALRGSARSGRGCCRARAPARGASPPRRRAPSRRRGRRRPRSSAGTSSITSPVDGFSDSKVAVAMRHRSRGRRDATRRRAARCPGTSRACAPGGGRGHRAAS